MGRPLGSHNKKSIWLLESLAKQGYDYEKTLVKLLKKATDGDPKAYAMAQLLVKMVPYIANMPKTDSGALQIETLVINRFDTNKQPESIDTTTVSEGELVEGDPPSIAEPTSTPTED